MGYYIDIIESDIFMDKSNFDEAYKRMCDLNQKDDLKGGGAYGGENDSRSPRPEGLNYHPGKWFSWMDPNYPEKTSTMEDVFHMLGFQDISYDEDGNLVYMSYSNKAGDEAQFLNCISDLFSEGSYISWQGEDNTFFRYTFTSQGMIETSGRIVFD